MHLSLFFFLNRSYNLFLITKKKMTIIEIFSHRLFNLIKATKI